MTLDDNFDLTRDAHQWILAHKYMGGKDGNQEKRNKSYHSDLGQVATYILGKMEMRCNTISELQSLYKVQAYKLLESLNGGLVYENIELKKRVKELEGSNG